MYYKKIVEIIDGVSKLPERGKSITTANLLTHNGFHELNSNILKVLN